MSQEWITKKDIETKNLGKRIAESIKSRRGRASTAFVIGLKGELGGGKTCFIQGFAKGLKIKEKILSPTFVILKKFKIQNYKSQKNSKFKIANPKYLYHIDCYRLNKSKDLLDLGFKKIISDPENIVVIEWADRVKKIMPKNSYWINFEFVDENTRKIIVDNFLKIN